MHQLTNRLTSDARPYGCNNVYYHYHRSGTGSKVYMKRSNELLRGSRRRTSDARPYGISLINVGKKFGGSQMTASVLLYIAN